MCWLTLFSLVLVLATLAPCWAAEQQALDSQNEGIRVGSFNVQVFGVTKFRKNDVVEILSKIVLRYDIVLIMEIRDSSMTIIHSFVDRVNRVAGDGVIYDLEVSERLGRSSRKEQYAYLYRTDQVKILQTYQFEDTDDVFEREPYGVLVQSAVNPAIPEFFLLGIRVRPDSTPAELNFMDDVYDQACKFFNNTESAILMGDLNADCGYLSHSEYGSLDLVTDERFQWVISGDEDTTTKDTFCAYDRMILAGKLVKHVARNKIEIFKFDRAYDLSYEEATEVSDHYPVGLVVQSSEVTAEDHVPDVPVFQDVLKKEASLAGGGIQVSAFNVRVFGTAKFSNDEVVDILSRIVRRYDIVLIQEIRDISETVIVDFLQKVNIDAAADGVTYDLVVSERLGRTSSREQYAYLYRNDTVRVLGILQYNDSAIDVFEREPFSILVKSVALDVPDFFLIGLHSKPTDTVSELNQLVEVYNTAATYFGTESGLILGDLNADCRYLTRSRYKQLELVTDSRFTWLINTTADTTTISTTNCAYDRFIVAGSIGGYIPQSSVGLFRYDLAYSLTQELTEAVSDHYPIECLVQGSLRSAVTSRSSETTTLTTSHSSPPPHIHTHTYLLAMAVISTLVYLLSSYSDIT